MFNLIKPDHYHGEKKKKNFFEGWYYKIVDKDSKNSLAFIPGIIKGKIVEEGHSFIQVLNGNEKTSLYLKFSQTQFHADKNNFEISVGKNRFSLNEMKLNHYDQDVQLIGSLKFVDMIKWPDTFLNPGSMGFYNYLKFMECYSQVVCLDGGVIGKLLIGDKEIDFTGGKVYIEKNWGKSFPQSYVWLQSNSFNNQDISFTCSIAEIPMHLFSFNGFLAALTVNKEIYQFTTLNHSKMNLTIKDSKNIKLTFINKDLELNVETYCKDEDFITCKGPINGKMDIPVKESLVSEIRIELVDLYKERLIVDCIGKATGIEMMGNIMQFIKKKHDS